MNRTLPPERRDERDAAMTVPTWRWRFVVEADAESDALIRVLTPFGVLGAELVTVTLARVAVGLSINVEAEGLDARRAETLLRRLEAMPVVRRVGFGWRGAP